ncbi:MAG: hypothetical protein PHR35_21375 [Kiritimatiellae bacterium]|nr:hypothetical protein [Kiritimatiellia bacterium]
MQAKSRRNAAIGVLVGIWVWCGAHANVVAAPVPLHELPAGTSWIVHADVARWVASPWYARFVAAVGESTPALRSLRAFEAASSVNITADVRSVTICGPGGEDAVAFLRGNLNAARLTAGLKTAPGFSQQRQGKWNLLSWPMRSRDGGSRRVHACFAGPGLLLLGENAQSVIKAAGAGEQAGGNLAAHRVFKELAGRTGDAWLSALVVDGSKVASGLAEADLLRQCETVTVALRPDRGGLAGQMDAVAINEDAAATLQQLLAAMQVMFSMRAASEPGLAALAETMQVSGEGRRVKVRAACDADAMRLLTGAAAREVKRKSRPGS